MPTYLINNTQLETVKVSTSTPLYNSRIGKLLYNTNTKQICFGIRKQGETAFTVTNKGIFQNQFLEIITNIEI